MFRTAVRRKSCRSFPGTPAFLHAVAHAFRKSSRRSAASLTPAEVREQVRDDPRSVFD